MSLRESILTLQTLQAQEGRLEEFIKVLKQAKHYNRIYLAGNGGSAATASHFASDLMNLGFDVTCMIDNICRLTALVNDVDWKGVYYEQMNLFDKGDVLILISVHGGSDKQSSNLVIAAERARHLKRTVLTLTGCDGGKLKDLSDVCIIVPSDSCCYVEGLHSLLTHIICERLKEEK